MKTLLQRRKIFSLLLSLTLLTACGKACQKGGGLGGLTGIGGKTDPLDIFPEKNNFLLSINVKKLSTLPIYADMMKDAPPEAKDLSTQVDEAMISLNLRGPTEKPSGLAVMTGSFDEKKALTVMEEAAKKQGTGEVKKEIFEGKTIYTSPKDPNLGMAFLSPHQVIWGQMADLKEALTLAKTKGPSIRSNKELMELYEKRDSKKLLWGAGIIPPSAMEGAANQPGSPMASLQGLKSFSINVDYDNKDLSINWTGNTQEPSQAQNMVNLINSYKTIFGASLAAQQPLWGEALQGMQITSQEKSIALGLKLSEALLKEISQQFAKSKAGAPMAAPAPEPAAPPPVPAPSGAAAQPAAPEAPPAPAAPVAPPPPAMPAAPAAPAPAVP